MGVARNPSAQARLLVTSEALRTSTQFDDGGTCNLVRHSLQLCSLRSPADDAGSTALYIHRCNATAPCPSVLQTTDRPHFHLRRMICEYWTLRRLATTSSNMLPDFVAADLHAAWRERFPFAGGKNWNYSLAGAEDFRSSHRRHRRSGSPIGGARGVLYSSALSLFLSANMGACLRVRWVREGELSVRGRIFDLECHCLQRTHRTARCEWAGAYAWLVQTSALKGSGRVPRL